MTMKDPNTKRRARLLTETELEMMNLLWRCGESSVRGLMDLLPPDRDLAYTSVSTMLRVLEQKGAVGSRKQGRGHIYFPLIAKPEYETRSLTHLVEKVFDGAPGALVRRLIEAGELSTAELREIQQLLGKRLN